MKLRSGTIFMQAHGNSIISEYVTPENEAIATINQNSLFLSLPAEIRLMTFSHLCANRIIHLTQDHPYWFPSTSIHHFLCQSRHTPERIFQNFLHASAKDTFQDFTETSHPSRPKKSGKNAANQRPDQISLAFLRTCRQVYDEAHLLPWTQNTFSFRRPETLPSFLSRYTAQPQLKYHLNFLRSIQLHVSIHHPDSEERWLRVLEKIPRRLKGLRSVHLLVQQVFCVCWLDLCTYEMREENEFWRAVCGLGGGAKRGKVSGGSRSAKEGIVERKEKGGKKRERSQISEVTVVIDDGDFLSRSVRWWAEGDYQEMRWTKEERRLWAQEVRRRILSGGGT